MKLNSDCVRDILLNLGELPFQQSCSVSDLVNNLPAYSEDEIRYCCLKLAEANYIDISTVRAVGMSGVGIKSVNDITFYGHEFLNNVRSDNVWKNVKAIGGKIGATSISSISQVATGVITQLIKNHLGL